MFIRMLYLGRTRVVSYLGGLDTQLSWLKDVPGQLPEGEHQLENDVNRKLIQNSEKMISKKDCYVSYTQRCKN